jgi:hypothetical protein
MGEDHHIVIQIFENKYGGNETFKGRFNKKTKINKMQIRMSVWLWGFRLSLKGMKLCINKP